MPNNIELMVPKYYLFIPIVLWKKGQTVIFNVKDQSVSEIHKQLRLQKGDSIIQFSKNTIPIKDSEKSSVELVTPTQIATTVQQATEHDKIKPFWGAPMTTVQNPTPSTSANFGTRMRHEIPQPKESVVRFVQSKQDERNSPNSSDNGKTYYAIKFSPTELKTIHTAE